jgi:uncharacterized membrane protein YqhA
MHPPPVIIFMSRWLQMPLYLGLIVVQAAKYFQEPAALHALGLNAFPPLKAHD